MNPQERAIFHLPVQCNCARIGVVGHRAGHVARLTHRRWPHCLGSTLSTVLIVCSVLGTFLIAAAIVTPMSLHASSEKAEEPVRARYEAHQQVIERVASLIGRSDELIALHMPGETPYTEVVLRLHNEGGQLMREGEIAVLSHSEILQTLTLYALIEGPDPDHGRQRYFHDQTINAVQQRRRLREPGFCNLWRSDPSVRARIIATGVTDMKIDILDRIDSARVRLRIELSWETDSTDGEDVASVVLNAVLRE